MITLQENISLKPFNTFGIDARARYFCSVESEQALIELSQRVGEFDKFLVLGGGSNVLFCGDYNGLIIHNNIKHREYHSNHAHVELHLGGGENWHQTVLDSVSKQLHGIENLALIPGTVGAAPVQNIGAYGVELKDIFRSLNAINLETGKLESFDLTKCRFAYRDSFFKQAGAGRYCITQVTLALKQQAPLVLGYGDVEDELQRLMSAEGVPDATPKLMSEAICNIRQRKLPDPAELPNAGSFFKNPIVSAAEHEALKNRFPSMVSYPVDGGHYKLAAGWLIDQLGWKGKALNGAKVHDRQALVLVNLGGGAIAICTLARQIQQDVADHYGVTLEPEPIWIE